MEDELLADLEDLAQKTDVLTHWADELYEQVKAIPDSMYPLPSYMYVKLTPSQSH
jgi:serine/threonine-protein kinase ULK/ATG1